MTPFLFFSDHRDALADAVREGRRREFGKFAAFADPARREIIPDPNAASTFESSVPRPDPQRGAARVDLYRRLLALRHAEIVPRLKGACAIEASALGAAAVLASWRMGDGAILTIAANLGGAPVRLDPPQARALFESATGAAAGAQNGSLVARSTVAFLETAA